MNRIFSKSVIFVSGLLMLPMVSANECYVDAAYRSQVVFSEVIFNLALPFECFRERVDMVELNLKNYYPQASKVHIKLGPEIGLQKLDNYYKRRLFEAEATKKTIDENYTYYEMINKHRPDQLSRYFLSAIGSSHIWNASCQVKNRCSIRIYDNDSMLKLFVSTEIVYGSEYEQVLSFIEIFEKLIVE